MNKRLILNFLMVFGFVFSTYDANADTKSVVEPNYGSVFELKAESLTKKSTEELEHEIGRKLTFKEKIALKSVKRKLKKNKELSGVDALEEVKTDGLAIAGLVTGIVGLFVFGIILGTLAIVFSGIALKRIKKEPKTRGGRGLAIAGLVTGIIGVLGWLIFILIVLSV